MNQIDYWMYAQLISALNEKYEKVFNATYRKEYQAIVVSSGVQAADAWLKQMNENQFHPLGKIFITRSRVEEIRDDVSLAGLKAMQS